MDLPWHKLLPDDLGSNKVKRFQFANHCLAWNDETSVQLECHQRHCFHNWNQRPKLKPCTKHPVKVPVWAAISKQWATSVWMHLSTYAFFILIWFHLFVQNFHPHIHVGWCKTMIPNTSRVPRVFFQARQINWWHTSSESRDLNHIENVWHELICHEVNLS